MQSRLLVDIVVRPEYVLRYEQHDEITFAHLDVHHWSARVARQFRADLDTSHNLLGRPLYVLLSPEAPNLPKFLKLHGFHPCGFVNDAQGRTVEIFERTLDGRTFRRWQPVH